MYEDIQPDLQKVIEPVVQAHGLELVDAILKQGKGKGQLQIIVDTPVGDGRVTIDACARVSREVGHNLDAQASIPGAYLLEVCSPGIDRVLAREIDFERSVGREVAVQTRGPVEGRKRFRGKLLAFADSVAQIQGEMGAQRIPFAQIAGATAFYPMAPPRKSKKR